VATPRQQSDHPLRPAAPQRRLTATLGPGRKQLPRSGPVFLIHGQATHPRHPEHCGRTQPLPDWGTDVFHCHQFFRPRRGGRSLEVVPNLVHTWHGDMWCRTAPMRGLLSWSNSFSVLSGTPPRHRSKRWAGPRPQLGRARCRLAADGANPARSPGAVALAVLRWPYPGKSESRWLAQGDAVTGAKVPR
jgi:hypothetical protein